MKDQKNTMTPEQGLAYATEIAQFRFALIAPLIQGLAPDASSTAYFKRVTKEPLTPPMGRRYSIAGKHHRSGIPCTAKEGLTR